jgi:hypothetical protein
MGTHVSVSLPLQLFYSGRNSYIFTTTEKATKIWGVAYLIILPGSLPLRSGWPLHAARNVASHLQRKPAEKNVTQS